MNKEGRFMPEKSKAKKLFLSCYSDELAVALELKNNLEYAFKQSLAIESPLDDMKCGDDWKEYIKERLADCDGLISLVTPAYAKRAWCIAEFIPFWVAGKNVFPVTIGFEDASTDIFKLVTDKYQTARLEDSDDVKKLLEAIAEFCGAPRPGIKYLDDIVNGCSREYSNIIAEESGIDAGQDIIARNRYIRRYLKNATVWECALNDEHRGVLSATCTKELCFVSASNDTQYVSMPLRALSEEGISFDKLDYDAGGKRVNIGNIVKSEESVFSYRINFRPALRQGETIKISYRINIPQYKPATKERAFEFAQKSERIELRKENVTIRLDAPADELSCKIVLAAECGVTPRELQVKWNNAINTEELDFIRANKSYTNTFDAEVGCVMELRRQKPKPGLVYVFSWDLPSESEIYD
ncbi:MAG: toll/interleukin-1 receptor domain-containing protein [Clostridiales Family XIII bacterium]|jgi:hypothetical protein|nr:toll/interleukin-1 receptor domain-containing protein [Clostridiales Family XIII bacterium]